MLRKRNLITGSLLSNTKIGNLEKLLSTSCVFKAVYLFDVVYSEIKAIRVSECIVWIELLRGFQCRGFKPLQF